MLLTRNLLRSCKPLRVAPACHGIRSANKKTLVAPVQMLAKPSLQFSLSSQIEVNRHYVREIHSSRPLQESFTQNLPDLGDSILSGYINEWVVQVGDYVEENQVIAVIDTDKVSVEIHAPVSGVLTKQYVTEIGAEIKVKEPLADFDVSAAAPAKSPSTGAAESKQEEAAPSTGTGEIYTHNLQSLGDSIASGVINEWVANVGDHVEENSVLLVVDTDKVSVEIHSPVSGKLVKKYKEEVGEEIHVNDPLVDIELGAAGNVATQAPAKSPEKEESTAQAGSSETVAAAASDSHGGRVPLIKFTHGKRDEPKVVAASSTEETPSVVGTGTSESGEIKDFLDMPEHFGRLPPMTDYESEKLMLGGAEPY